MDIKDLKNKLVAVLGYAVEGKATAKYLLQHGISPVLFDAKPWAKWSAHDQETIKALGINFIFGEDCLKELKGFDVVFRSPGVKLSAISVQLSAGTVVTSQTKWFFEHCPAKIIGVTGTKGKGTTCALIYEILKENFQNAKNKIQTSSKSKTSNLKPNIYLTGNIGQIQPFEILEHLYKEDFVVFELSSFQLQDLNVSPHIGVVLMVTSEHLDYHQNIKEYHEAKTAITKFQIKNDFAIINKDFPASQSIGSFGKGKKIFFSRTKSAGIDCLVKNNEISVPKFKFNFPVQQLQLKGRHNLENVCAAAMTALLLNIKPPAIKKALKNFKGLEHRLEFVTEKNKVKFYNDSFSTTPETAIAAINAFTEPEILILGGSSKNSNFIELGKVISSAKNLKAIILIGQEAGKIKDAIKKNKNFSGKIFEDAQNMKEIFQQIESIATNGDVVILSPACASFGMFADYKDRGNQFKKAAMASS